MEVRPKQQEDRWYLYLESKPVRGQLILIDDGEGGVGCGIYKNAANVVDIISEFSTPIVKWRPVFDPDNKLVPAWLNPKNGDGVGRREQLRASGIDHERIGMQYMIYVGWLRYPSTSTHKWIAAAINPDSGSRLGYAFDDLDAGDMDASAALDFITNNADLFEYGDSPSSAVTALERAIQDKFNSA